MIRALAIFVLTMMLSRVADASPFAELDIVSTRMPGPVADIQPTLESAQQGYFDAPIPRRVHQIWYGDAGRRDDRGPRLWQEHCRQHGYTYRLWTEADDAEVERLMPPRNFSLLKRFRDAGEYWSASDLLRLSLLQSLGGIYSDVDMGPPQWQGQIIDLARVVPMRGLAMMSEHHCRNVNNTSVFFANGFMMAAPHHPMVEHLERQVADNVYALTGTATQDTHALEHNDAAHTTGPFFVNRLFSGVATVLPITYMHRLNMLPGDG